MADKNDIPQFVNSDSFMADKNYVKWLSDLKKRFHIAQLMSLDLRAEFPQAEGFSWSNLYKIRKWYLFYSSQIEFLYQAVTKLQKVDNATTPMPDLLQFYMSDRERL